MPHVHSFRQKHNPFPWPLWLSQAIKGNHEIQPVGTGTGSIASARRRQSDRAGTSAWAWQDQSTRHSPHGLEQDPMTSGYKMMTETGREQWFRGKEGKQEAGPGTACSSEGVENRKGSWLGWLFVVCFFFFFLFPVFAVIYEGRELRGTLKIVLCSDFVTVLV